MCATGTATVPLGWLMLDLGTAWARRTCKSLVLLIARLRLR
jgi:hypothetical protein